jgi:DNA polymerase III delta prime subunit
VPYTRLLKQATNLELPLEALEAIVDLRKALEDLEAAAVSSARARGATWEQIASVLGVTRQAAFLRHRDAGRGTDEGAG